MLIRNIRKLAPYENFPLYGMCVCVREGCFFAGGILACGSVSKLGGLGVCSPQENLGIYDL